MAELDTASEIPSLGWQGLNPDGWASLNTLKCCSYLCDKQQWSALKEGALVWGGGARNRYSSAVRSLFHPEP